MQANIVQEYQETDGESREVGGAAIISVDGYTQCRQRRCPTKSAIVGDHEKSTKAKWTKFFQDILGGKGAGALLLDLCSDTVHPPSLRPVSAQPRGLDESWDCVRWRVSEIVASWANRCECQLLGRKKNLIRLDDYWLLSGPRDIVIPLLPGEAFVSVKYFVPELMHNHA